MRYAPLLLTVGFATPALAGGDRTLHLAVHGSIDRAALAASLARELGSEVALADATCEAPCLDVAIEHGRTATVRFSPRDGEARWRSVTLDADARQWPLVLTLLAGNVVRDEAQDVLAGLPLPEPAPPPVDAPEAAPPPTVEAAPPATVARPPAPTAPPAAAAPAVLAPPLARAEPEREHRWLGLGFVPGASTDLTHIGSVRHSLSVHVLVGVSGGSQGLAISGIADVERGSVDGVQLAGVAAVAERLAGTQFAGVAAVAGEVDGVQLAGTAAVARRLAGVQVAGVAAVSRSSAATQVGGVAAVALGRAETQAAGVASVARGDAHLQIAGVANVARGTATYQLSGVVNVAERLGGLQVAPVNVARRGGGVQIGVVNVAGSADGFSLGLVNIVPGGRTDLETAIDSSQTGTLLLRHGGRRWHNVYGVAGHPVEETGRTNDVWMYGFGFGPSVRQGDTLVDLELIGWQVNHGIRHGTDVSVLGQLRLTVAHPVGPLSIVAGGVLNTYVTNDRGSPLLLERKTAGSTMDRDVTITVWPSAFVGIRI